MLALLHRCMDMDGYCTVGIQTLEPTSTDHTAKAIGVDLSRQENLFPLQVRAASHIKTNEPVAIKIISRARMSEEMGAEDKGQQHEC